MSALPNILSFLRIPLALWFIPDHAIHRYLVVILAMISDGLDGYLARRYHWSSRFGTILDPISDKFFMFVVVMVLIGEGSLSLGEAAAMLARDMALILFGMYLLGSGRLSQYQCRAILSGKVTTAFQLVVILLIIGHISIPFIVFVLFAILGVLALVELFATMNTCLVNKNF